jgi:hypothetical protein
MRRLRKSKMNLGERDRSVLANSLWEREQALRGWIGRAAARGGRALVESACADETRELRDVLKLSRRLRDFEKRSSANRKGSDVARFNAIKRDRSRMLQGMGSFGKVTHKGRFAPQDPDYAVSYS